MKISIYNSTDEMSKAAADLVAAQLAEKPASLIVFPSGESPTGMLRNLVQYAKGGKIDLTQCTIIGLDEWVGMDETDEGSCKHYLYTNFFSHLDLDPERIVMFNAKAADLEAECERMNTFISSHGGLDVMIVGIGMNGHLGLNEPGTSFDLYAHRSELDPVTVQVGQKYFSKATELSEGITLGLKHLSEAKKAVLIASGAKKAVIIAEGLQGTVSTEVPASILQRIPNALILLDKDAASETGARIHKLMDTELQQIRLALQNAPAILATKKVAAGFDGFVDSIVKVVNSKTADGTTEYFDTIKQFGNYISGKSGSGFSLESEEQLLKLGGNMPIMANAMAQMGAGVACVGAFGVPVAHTAFADMHPKCQLHSFTNPGFTTAMEFADGKIMLAQMTDLNHADWQTIRSSIGIEKLRKIFSDTDLICLVNWSELDQSNKIWQGLLEDVLAVEAGNTQSRHFFFDLSDLSKRSAEAIRLALDLIKEFGSYGSVTLSLNRNEAGIMYKILLNDTLPDDLKVIGNQLFPLLSVATLIIHTAKISLAWDNCREFTQRSRNSLQTLKFLRVPVIISTRGTAWQSF